MSLSNTQPKRTLLYYPTIDVPSGPWLRQALLYWDEVASIVPKTYDNQIPSDRRYTEPIRFLQQEGCFRPINPERLLQGQASILAEFQAELTDALDSEEFGRLLARQPSRSFTSKIYKDKLTNSIHVLFLQRRLAKDEGHNDTYYYLEKNAALLYMAVLAKYLADTDWDLTVPGTDLQLYEDLNLKPLSGANSINLLETRFRNTLPIPRDGVKLTKILEFREGRKDNLRRFRGTMDSLEIQLKDCTNDRDVRDVLAHFKEDLEQGVNDLQAVLDDAKLPTVTGTMKAIFKPNVVLGGGIVAAAGALSVGMPVSMPLMIASASFGVGAIAEVADLAVNARNERRKTLGGSQYSYLYSAKQEGIV